MAGDTQVVVQIPPVHSFGGRITDRDGNGVAGNMLCLVHSGCFSHYCSRSCTNSDAQGRYQLNLSEGTYDTQVFSASGPTFPVGRYQLAQTISITQATELDLTFANRIVTGTVLNLDGTPAPNVPVSDSCHDIDVNGFVGRACAATATTDADGRFQMSLPGPGDVVLTAGGALPTSVPFTVTDDMDVTIQLQAAQAASGRVVNADGSPAVDASVCYETPNFLIGACVSTDSSGQYQVALPAGQYSLSVSGSAPGISFFSLGESVALPSAPIVVPLVATRPVPLRLVNTDGSPIVGSSIAGDCVVAPAAGSSEEICGQPTVSDAAGSAAVLAPVGVPVGLQIYGGPGIDAPSALIDNLVVSDGTELTIAIQSPPASP